MKTLANTSENWVIFCVCFFLFSNVSLFFQLYCKNKITRKDFLLESLRCSMALLGWAFHPFSPKTYSTWVAFEVIAVSDRNWDMHPTKVEIVWPWKNGTRKGLSPIGIVCSATLLDSIQGSIPLALLNHWWTMQARIFPVAKSFFSGVWTINLNHQWIINYTTWKVDGAIPMYSFIMAPC